MLDLSTHSLHSYVGGNKHNMSSYKPKPPMDAALPSSCTGHPGKKEEPKLSDGTAGEAGSLPPGMKEEGGGIGVSNTPVTTYLKTGIEASIDYFKVTLPIPFGKEEFRDYWDDILKALHLPFDCYVKMKRGGALYERGWIFNEDTFIFSGGDLTKNSMGQETAMIEMKGDACRRFEERAIYENWSDTGINDRSKAFINNAWREFFEVLSKFLIHVTRFNVPVDDFGDIVPLSELKEKVAIGALTSPLRKHDRTYELDDDYVPSTIREGGLGWSFSLGGRSTQQLVIYDKKAETEKKYGKGSCLLPSWVRYESRFYHNKADSLFPELLKSLQSEDPLAFQKFAIGCLDTLISFKDKKLEGDNAYKSPVWDKWQSLIDTGSVPQPLRIEKPLLTIKGNAEWLKKEVFRTFFRVSAAYIEDMTSIFRYALQDGIAKATQEDFAILNASRKERGLEPFKTIEEAQSAVFWKAGLSVLPSDPVLSLFDEKRETKLVNAEEGDY